MTPWRVHGLRATGLRVECLNARRVKPALQMRFLLAARAQLVGMRTLRSNLVRGVLKTFGILPGATAVRGSIHGTRK